MSAGKQVNVVAILPGAWNRPGWNEPANAAELRNHFADAGWPANARMMLGAVHEWRRWALFAMPDGGVWHKGPVALLGDAAHAMLPFVAQGAGMAIEDAAVLAKCLGDFVTDPTNIQQGLKRYAAMRKSRVGRVQRTARQSGQIYHLRGPMALARDLTMKVLGAQRLQMRQDWIYSWKA
jgi:salicylate hydroxylase